MQAQVKVALADDKVDPVSEVFGIYAELLDRHLIEKDLENDGLATAFDYKGALKRDGAMDLLDRQRQKLACFDVSLIDSHVEGDTLMCPVSSTGTRRTLSARRGAIWRSSGSMPMLGSSKS